VHLTIDRGHLALNDENASASKKFNLFQRGMQKMVDFGRKHFQGLHGEGDRVGFMSQEAADKLLALAKRIHDSTPTPFHWFRPNSTMRIEPPMSANGRRQDRVASMPPKVQVDVFPSYEGLTVPGSRTHNTAFAALDTMSKLKPGDFVVILRPRDVLSMKTHIQPFWIAKVLEPGPYVPKELFLDVDTPDQADAEWKEFVQGNAKIDLGWYAYRLPSGTRREQLKVNILSAVYLPSMHGGAMSTETMDVGVISTWFPSLTQGNTIPQNIRSWIMRDCAMPSKDQFTIENLQKRTAAKSTGKRPRTSSHSPVRPNQTPVQPNAGLAPSRGRAAPSKPTAPRSSVVTEGFATVVIYN